MLLSNLNQDVNSKEPRIKGDIVATRILLVDDDPKIISLLKRGLAYEGFEVYTALDGP